MSVTPTPQQAWQTSVSEMEGRFATLYGYGVDDLARSRSFTEGVFLAMTGELPKPRQREMLDRVLLLSIAHGVAPSGAVARSMTVCGSPIQAALAAGAMTFGDVHGGAGEALAQQLQQVVLEVAQRDGVAEAADQALSHFRDRGQRTPGFGHALHTDGDPRATFLLDSARGLGIAARGCELVVALEDRLAAHLGRRVPMNVDGALVGVMLDLGIDWQFSRALMILARLPVLAAQVIEETVHPSPGWRDLVLVGERYQGPPRRAVPDE